MISKEPTTIIAQMFTHMSNVEGRRANPSNWYIGIAPSIELCCFRKHKGKISEEFAYAIWETSTIKDAKDIQDYMFSVEFEKHNNFDEEGTYVYMCIIDPSKKAIRSKFAGKLISKDDLISHYELGERDFSEVHIKGFELQDVSIAGIDLSLSNIEDSSFINVNLNNSNIRGSSIKNSLFENVNLCDSNLEEISVKKTKVVYSKFKNSCVKNSTIEHCEIAHSDLSISTLTGLNIRSDDSYDLNQSQKSTLKNCCLICANISDSFLRGLVISESDLRQADLRGAELMFFVSSTTCITGDIKYMAEELMSNGVNLQGIISDSGILK